MGPRPKAPTGEELVTDRTRGPKERSEGSAQCCQKDELLLARVENTAGSVARGPLGMWSGHVRLGGLTPERVRSRCLNLQVRRGG